MAKKKLIKIEDWATTILEHLIENGYSCQYLSDKFGFAPSTIKRWLKGGVPNNKALEVVAAHTGENDAIIVAKCQKE